MPPQFRLEPAREQLLDFLRRTRMRGFERDLPLRREQFIEQFGMGAPEVAKLELEEYAKLIEEIGGVRARMGVRQLGEVRQERLVGEEREARQQMTFAQWSQQEKMQRTAFGEARAVRERQFGRQRQLIEEGRTFAETERKRAEKRQKGQLLTRLLTSVGMGLLTGGLGAGLGLMKGAAGAAIPWWKGALAGGAMGGGQIGQIVGQQMMFPQQAGAMPQAGVGPGMGRRLDLWPQWMMPQQRRF